MAIRSISAFASVPTVTSLPTDPTDTPEVDLVVDDTPLYGGPYIWRCKYRAATTGIYKWHVVGGGPALESAQTALASTTSTTYVSTATVPLPSLVLPNAGYWLVEAFSNQAWINASTANYGLISYTVGGTAATDLDAATVYGVSPMSSVVARKPKTIPTAGTALQMQVKSPGGFGFFVNNQAGVLYGLRAYPVRLA